MKLVYFFQRYLEKISLNAQLNFAFMSYLLIALIFGANVHHNSLLNQSANEFYQKKLSVIIDFKEIKIALSEIDNGIQSLRNGAVDGVSTQMIQHYEQAVDDVKSQIKSAQAHIVHIKTQVKLADFYSRFDDYKSKVDDVIALSEAKNRPGVDELILNELAQQNEVMAMLNNLLSDQPAYAEKFYASIQHQFVDARMIILYISIVGLVVVLAFSLAFIWSLSNKTTILKLDPRYSNSTCYC